MKTLTILLVFGLTLLNFTGCGSSSTDTDTISFIDGGTYGSYSNRSVNKENQDLNLPSLNPPLTYDIKSNDYADAMPFFSFGGAKSQINDVYQFNANNTLGDATELKYQVFPNFSNKAGVDFTRPQNVYLLGYKLLENKKEVFYCIEQTNGKFETRPASNDWHECLSNPLIKDFMFDSNETGIELSFDLGRLTSATTEYKFILGSDLDGQVIPMSEMDTSYDSTVLNQHDHTLNPYPENTIASSGFLPNRDGFGFINIGPVNYDPSLISANDMAMLYGKESVCYNNGDTDCQLNAYGYYLRDLLTDSGGGQCFGFSVAATMLYKGTPFLGKSTPSTYNPKVQNTIDLDYSDMNELITIMFKSQSSKAYFNYLLGTAQNTLPSQTLQIIADAFNTDNPIAGLGMYQKPLFSDENPAHNVLPYAITKESDDLYRIYVYDNNFPSDTTRHIDVDITDEHWKYSGSTVSGGPEDIYEGYGLENPLYPIPLNVVTYQEPLEDQPNHSTRFTNLTPASQKSGELVHMTIEDTEGNFSGWDPFTLQWVNEIPDTYETLGYSENGDFTFTTLGTKELTSLQLITSRSALQPYLNESFTVGFALYAKLIEGSQFSGKFNFSSITDLYSNGIRYRQLIDKGMEARLLKVHPSSRIIAIHNPSPYNGPQFSNH